MTGPDSISTKIIKVLEGNRIDLLIFNNIYSTGNYPESWLKSTFIALPKKPNQKNAMILG